MVKVAGLTAPPRAPDSTLRAAAAVKSPLGRRHPRGTWLAQDCPHGPGVSTPSVEGRQTVFVEHRTHPPRSRRASWVPPRPQRGLSTPLMPVADGAHPRFTAEVSGSVTRTPGDLG